jgi:glycosyltransferase involved in cell wall biosynthesis
VFRMKNIFNTSPLVSIIIPYYNDGKYIGKTLKSIYCNEYVNFEVIIIDDCSNVENQFEIQKLSKIYNFKYSRLNENVGQATAKNKGVAMSKGELLFFHDADDYIASDYLTNCVSILLSKENVKAVSTNLMIEDVKTGKIWKFQPTGGEIKDFILRNGGTGMFVMRKSDFLETSGYNESYRGWEDWDFLIRLLKDGGQFYIYDSYSYYYRVGKDSTTQRVNNVKQKLHNQLIKNNRDVFLSNFDIIIQDYLNSKYNSNIHIRKEKFSLSKNLKYCIKSIWWKFR